MTERPTDDVIIRQELEAARSEHRDISSRVARIIASQWHSGMSSAFYSFVSTGAIDIERMTSELVADYVEAETDQDRFALDALSSHLRTAEGVDASGTRPAVESWNEDYRW